MSDYIGTATYSPEDNKLRLYPFARLDEDTYKRVRESGFIWAPKQSLFVAPMWTPWRENLLLELCGEIGDEDTTLVERAEERADRFEDYSEKRTQDAESAQKAVHAIADNIPMGQPILVGHHSEKRARKDAEKIENGMRRSIKMWETAQYWKERAAGALAHAKYKELPGVRARRIKGLEADERKQLKNLKELEAEAFAFSLIDKPEKWKPKENGEILTREERAAYIAGRTHAYGARKEDGSGHWTFYDLFRLPVEDRYKATPTVSIDDALAFRAKMQENTERTIQRWLQHIRNRLEYERAMLNESGGLVAQRQKMEPGGRVLRRHGEWFLILKVNRDSVTVSGHFARTIPNDEIKDYRPPTPEEAAKVKAAYKLPPLCNYPGEGFLHMTKAEYEAKKEMQWRDFPKIGIVKATETNGAHRVRQCRAETAHHLAQVYLTDEKRKDPPPRIDSGIDFKPTKETRTRETSPAVEEATHKEAVKKISVEDAEKSGLMAELAQNVAAMKQRLRAGIQVVSAPQLFPTPPELAASAVALAQIDDSHRVLEPSAGTGNLVKAINDAATNGELVAVEINRTLADQLERIFGYPEVTEEQASGYKVVCADFLQCNGDLGTFDRIVMNPPFRNGDDIKHIKHALKFLRDGGRLVAFCANGPRQQEQLKPICTEWNDLPPGSFSDSGTEVNAAIIVIDK